MEEGQAESAAGVEKAEKRQDLGDVINSPGRLLITNIF